MPSVRRAELVLMLQEPRQMLQAPSSVILIRIKHDDWVPIGKLYQRSVRFQGMEDRRGVLRLEINRQPLPTLKDKVQRSIFHLQASLALPKS